MKCAVVFLFLAIGTFVSTNANPARGKMSESSAVSCGRSLAFIMNRYGHYQKCGRCSDIERYCMEKAIILDVLFYLRLLAGDLGCSHRDLTSQLKVKFHLDFFNNAIERDELDQLCHQVRIHQQIDIIIQSLTALTAAKVKQAGMELENILASVNSVVGGALSGLLSAFSGLLNIAGVATELLGGLPIVGDIAGGFTNMVGGLPFVGDAVGGFTNMVGGLPFVGDAASSVTNMVGGLPFVGDAASSVTNMVGGLPFVGGFTNLFQGVGGKKPKSG